MSHGASPISSKKKINQTTVKVGTTQPNTTIPAPTTDFHGAARITKALKPGPVTQQDGASRPAQVTPTVGRYGAVHPIQKPKSPIVQ